ncbi:MAG: sulfurtransferase [Alphaproteobacteria bacterium]
MPIRAVALGATLTFAFSAAALADPIAGGGPLVSAEWLQANLADPRLAVLDVRSGIDGGSAETFATGHVPGAVHSDYLTAGWRVERDGAPGMLPEIGALEALIGGLGIDNGDHVVIVPAGLTSTDLGSATRVYWTFKVLGHDAVSILDGGTVGWVAAGLPTESGASASEPATFTATFRSELLATEDDVRAAVEHPGVVTLIDARPVEQYLGLGQHPAAGAAGTLPGAVNTPQESLATIDGAHLRNAQTLDYLFAQAGIADDRPNIAFCNTGHWASIAWFASSEILGQHSQLYDGSMVQWTADPDNPVAVPASAVAAQ